MASAGVRSAPVYTSSPSRRRSWSVRPRAATRPPAIGMMSVVVVPVSITMASGKDRATSCAVAAQFAAATASGSIRAAATLRNRPSAAYTRTSASGNAAVTASSTKRTPSRLVRKNCDSSAVIVTAWAAPVARCSAASRASREPSAVGSRWISYGWARAAATVPRTTRATFVFTPPTSQPNTAVIPRTRGSRHGLAVGRRLPEGLLDLDLDGPNVHRARAGELPAHASREVLREHLHRRVGDGEQGAVDLRKDVLGLARDGDGQRVALLPHCDLGILRRQQHLVIDLVREPLHQALQLREVEHVVGLGVEAAFDHDAGAVVMAVQRLAAVARERDEVRGGEDEVVLRHRHLELAMRRHRPVSLPRSSGPPPARRRSRRR